MFPNMVDVEITQTLDSFETTDECVSSLLDSNSEKGIRVQEKKNTDKHWGSPKLGSQAVPAPLVPIIEKNNTK